jgi:hypothetical protein
MVDSRVRLEQGEGERLQEDLKFCELSESARKWLAQCRRRWFDLAVMLAE